MRALAAGMLSLLLVSGLVAGEPPGADALRAIAGLTGVDSWRSVERLAADTGLADAHLAALSEADLPETQRQAALITILVRRNAPAVPRAVAGLQQLHQRLRHRPRLPATDQTGDDSGLAAIGGGEPPITPNDPYRYLRQAHTVAVPPSEDAAERTVLSYFVTSSGRPFPSWEGTPFAGSDQAYAAVAFRRLLNGGPSPTLDRLVLGELAKSPVLEIHRTWCLDYVAQRKLTAAIPVLVAGEPAWSHAERTPWKSAIALALGGVGGAEAERALLGWSLDAAWESRYAAIQGLRKFDTATARARLAQLAADDTEAAVRKFAAQTPTAGP